MELTPSLWTVFGFLLGASMGSFIATLLLRWPRGESVVAGRSRCDSCGKTLRTWELVPLLSWLAARGQCRRCGAPIDPRHFAVELGAALLGAVALALQPGLAGLMSALFGWWLLTLAALDAEHHWLPDRLTLPLIPLGLGAALIPLGPDLVDRLIGAAAGFGVLAAIGALYKALRGRRGMGGGDPKLLGAIGAWVGWYPLSFVLACAGLLGLASLALKGARGGTVSAADRLPFGTLLAVAAWPAWLWVGAA